MKNNITILLIFISSYAFSQNDLKPIIDFYDSEFSYINKPNKKDTSCINEINKAKEDIDKGKIVFCTPVGFLFGILRFENELKKVVENYGLKFKIDLISDVEIEGQTQGCYGAYMTNFIKKKYGENFRKKIYNKADSLYVSKVIENNRIVDNWDCDIAPYQIGGKPERDYTITLNINNLQIPIDCSETILMDINFIIELDGTTNNYNVSNKVLGNKKNELYYNKLLTHSINELKKIDNWSPGQLKETYVRTLQNVRVYITNKK